MANQVQSNDELHQMINHLQTWVESDDQFPIDFDKVWIWLGYSRKDVAKRKLISVCKHGEFQLKLVHTITGGTDREEIKLSHDGFKRFCISAHTEKSAKIHGYYLSLEKKYAKDHPESVIKYSENELHKMFHEPFATENELHVDVAPRRKIEHMVSDKLSKQLNGVREYQLECGIVDVLTDTEAIEVKMARNWKHALGQAIAYSVESQRSPRIHLIGEVPDIAVSICKSVNVRLTSESNSY